VKKMIGVIFSILLVLGLLTVGELNPVNAKSDGATPVVPAIAAGSWTALTGAGTDVDVTQSAQSAPGWLQLLSSTGIKVTTPGKMCYPFRGGQYGWVPQIHQNKNGVWTRLATTAEWVPSAEGELMACANVSAAGTYALFGYYKAPQTKAVEPSKVTPFDCDSVVWDPSGWSTGGDGSNYYAIYGGHVTGLTTGTEINITVDPENSDEGLSTVVITTTVLDVTGFFTVKGIPIPATPPDKFQLIYTLPAYGCTYSFPFYYE